MDSYGWKTKLWKFKTLEEGNKQREEMLKWMDKWKHKYQFRRIFVNNAFALEYKLLIKG